MSEFIVLEFIEPGPPYVCIHGKDYYVDNKGKGHYYLLSENHLSARCTEEIEKICENAYHNLKQLKCIRIPSVVTSIGLHAFSKCTALESVIFDYPDDMSIGSLIHDGHFENLEICSEDGSSHSSSSSSSSSSSLCFIKDEHLEIIINECGKIEDIEKVVDNSREIYECEHEEDSHSHHHHHDKHSHHHDKHSHSDKHSHHHHHDKHKQEKCPEQYMDFIVYETSLRSFTIDGIDVLDKSILRVKYKTKCVKVIAVPYECKSNIKIIGGIHLKPGSNMVTVIVTSPQGDTRRYNVIVFVNLLPDELACLLEGTLVRTPDGYVPIETIREGDYIRTLKYDIVVTKVGKWEVDLNDEKQRNDLSRKMYKIPAGVLNCNKDTYISHYHRILMEDASQEENPKLFRLPEKIGLQVANPHEFAVDGKFRFYHLQVKYGNYFMVSGGCIVEAWESGAKYF